MKIKVHRKWPKADHCMGVMEINGEYFCNTLEDKIVDVDKSGEFDNGEIKVHSKSAIPFGTYEVIYNYSPTFKRKLPRLIDVPHFTGILIHPGNDNTDTAGCILVGINSSKGALSQSRAYSDKLNAMIEEAMSRGEDISIKIV